MPKNYNSSDEYLNFKAQIGATGAGQLGEFTREVNLYKVIDQTGIGKSMVGREMDEAGRWMFNHRFGGGHLWWKELANRPTDEWGAVLEHLSSDFFTKAGIPYLFDANTIRDHPDLLRKFGAVKSSDNWAMINGFEFLAGSTSLVFSIYDAVNLKHGYTSDLSLGLDSLFVALNTVGGIATANPLLIIAAVVKTTTMLRKRTLPLGFSSDSPFDIDVTAMSDFNHSFDFDTEKLFHIPRNFDFSIESKTYSFTKIKKDENAM